MNDRAMIRHIPLLSLAAAMALPGTAAGQEAAAPATQVPAPVPAPVPTGAPMIAAPAATPTPRPPRAPVPTPRPAARPTPRTAAPAARPTPRPAPAAATRPAPAPRPATPVLAAPTPPPAATGDIAVLPSAVPSTDPRQDLIAPGSLGTPAPLPSPAPITPLPERRGIPAWTIVLALLALAAAGIALMFRRDRQRRHAAEEAAAVAATQEVPSAGTGFWVPAVPATLPPAAEPVAPAASLPPEPQSTPADPPPAVVPEAEPEEPEEPESAPAAPPVAEAPRAPAPVVEAPAAPAFLEPAAASPRLALAVAPRRAGLNLLTATADVEVTVANAGAAPLAGIRLAAGLATAADVDATTLAAFADGDAPRPVVAPFALAPGESRTIRTIVTLPLSELRAHEIGGRGIVVPALIVDVRHDAGQHLAAYLLGIVREGSDKLAPFRTDAPRMIERVAVRPHGAPLER